MEEVKRFLESHWDGAKPLLLGYSGGPDSKALLYSLLEAGCRSLHVAHVDHGWREESAEEAFGLQKEVASLGLPFSMTRLAPAASGNREALAREQRMAYFNTLFAKTPYQALLLAHQADDLAETSLKRLLEGAHLPFLGGMKGCSQIGQLPIWRPLLQTRRREILRFLHVRQLKPLYDPTNRDPKYLRSRMREEMIPFLCRSLGKEVVDNLICLSKRSFELQQYLDRKVEHCPVKRGPWGVAICCGQLERIEQRHLLQKGAQEMGLVLPRPVLDSLFHWLDQGVFHRKISLQRKWITVYKEWVIFFCCNPLTSKQVKEILLK